MSTGLLDSAKAFVIGLKAERIEAARLKEVETAANARIAELTEKLTAAEGLSESLRAELLGKSEEIRATLEVLNGINYTPVADAAAAMAIADPAIDTSASVLETTEEVGDPTVITSAEVATATVEALVQDASTEELDAITATVSEEAATEEIQTAEAVAADQVAIAEAVSEVQV